MAISERPALAIYDTLEAAHSRAFREHQFMEPARVIPIWITPLGKKRLSYYG